MRAYPWGDQHSPERKRKGNLKIANSTSVPLLVLAIILCPPAALIVLWGVLSFHHFNDNWYKRGLIGAALGVVVTLITFRPETVAVVYPEMLRAFGNNGGGNPGEAVMAVLVTMLGPAMIAAGLSSLGFEYDYNWESRTYLKPTKPNMQMKLRMKKNAEHLSKAAVQPGYVRVGVIADDRMPWRSPRYGMVVERPIDKLGHAILAATNGAGKTITALTVAYHFVANGGSFLMMDFKGSLSTRNKCEAIAKALGVPFLSFDMTAGAGRSTWYDSLDFPGSPSSKTAMLMGSFNFSESGGGEYYTGVARTWLTFQFEVLDRVGLRAGESRFDFLLSTCDPNKLQERFSHLRTSDSEADRTLYTEWAAKKSGVKATDLNRLRDNLASVVNAAGPRLRPSTSDATPISLRSLDREPSIIYIGLSAFTDDTALKVIGSLALKDLSVFAGERFDGTAPPTRPILAVTDEASRLKDQAKVMDPIFAQARESLIWLWSATQSVSPWPDSTVGEMMANVTTVIAGGISDEKTYKALTQSLGAKFVIHETRKENVSDRVLRSREYHEFTDANNTHNKVEREPFLMPDDLVHTPLHHVYLWLPEPGRHPTRKKWVSRRLPIPDENRSDAPLVKVIPPAFLLEDHSAPVEVVANDFGSYVSPVTAAEDSKGSWDPEESLTEAQQRRMDEFRRRRLAQQEEERNSAESPQWETVPDDDAEMVVPEEPSWSAVTDDDGSEPFGNTEPDDSHDSTEDAEPSGSTMQAVEDEFTDDEFTDDTPTVETVDGKAAPSDSEAQDSTPEAKPSVKAKGGPSKWAM